MRKTGGDVSNTDILKFSRFFEDELTLDNLSRQQLIALCKLIEARTIGTDNLLRFHLRSKLRALSLDDKMIQREGLAALTVPELQQACRARGMRALGVAEEKLRSQLSQWLELSQKENIPPSLLLLSRVLFLPEHLPAAEQIKATIQALPQEVVTEAKYKIGETEGKIDNKTKLELLKQEEAAIKKDKEEQEKKKLEEKKKKDAAAAAVVVEETLIDKAPIIDDKASLIVDKAEVLVDKAIEMKDAAAEKTKEETERKELSKADLQNLEEALEQIESEKKSLVLEKEDLEDIKEELADYKEDIKEFKEVSKLTGNADGLKERKAAKNLRRKVDQMVENMEKALGGLESTKQAEKLKHSIGDLVKASDSEEEHERKKLVNINQLISVMKKDDDENSQRVIDVLDMIDADHDGNVEVELVMKVVEFLQKEDVEVTKEEIKELVQLFSEEEKLEEEEKKEKEARKEEEAASNGKKASEKPVTSK